MSSAASLLSLMANHLWQSSVFATVVALLTLVLRSNQARTRYWLWVAASMKFLIPFALLASLSSHLPWNIHPVANAATPSLVLLQEFGQPFAMPEIIQAVHQTTPATAAVTPIWPTSAVVVWLVGAIGILGWSLRRWRNIQILARQATPLSEGRAIDAMRRLQNVRWLFRPIPVFTSGSSLEPGLFGVFRPVLLFPAGMVDRLDDLQMEAVIAHELSHARRHDNLWAMTHMLVEAAFWFHPFVWLLGSRLVEERERACDEDVMSQGCEPEVYARAMVRICEFCLAWPVKCVSGITGSSLKKRIEAIMLNRAVLRLNLAKKALLIAVGIASVSVALVFGSIRPQNTAAVLKFEVVSIKPAPTDVPQGDPRYVIGLACRGVDGIRRSQSGTTGDRAVNAPQGRCVGQRMLLSQLIQFAYDTSDRVTSVTPDAVRTVAGLTFQVEGSAENPSTATSDELRRMLQQMLADQFKLQFHRETKDTDGYELVVDKGGARLKEAKPTGKDDNPDLKPVTVQAPPDLPTWEPGWNVFKGIASMKVIAQTLNPFVIAPTGAPPRPLVDRTGLLGTYDVTLIFPRGIGNQATPELLEQNLDLRRSMGEKQLKQFGLRVQPAKVPLESIVIDHAEKPTEN